MFKRNFGSNSQVKSGHGFEDVSKDVKGNNSQYEKLSQEFLKVVAQDNREVIDRMLELREKGDISFSLAAQKEGGKGAMPIHYATLNKNTNLLEKLLQDPEVSKKKNDAQGVPSAREITKTDKKGYKEQRKLLKKAGTAKTHQKKKAAFNSIPAFLVGSIFGVVMGVVVGVGSFIRGIKSAEKGREQRMNELRNEQKLFKKEKQISIENLDQMIANKKGVGVNNANLGHNLSESGVGSRGEGERRREDSANVRTDAKDIVKDLQVGGVSNAKGGDDVKKGSVVPDNSNRSKASSLGG